jgi:Na+/H+ antiporter NhaD/arsenite permease-like protein
VAHSRVFAGLFVMVGALVNTGVVEGLANAATDATEGKLMLASGVLLWASAEISAIVDNIPYVAKYGLVVAAVTIVISMVYLWLRYFAFSA